MPRLEALQALQEAQPLNISDAELLKNIEEQQKTQDEEASRQSSDEAEGSDESDGKILGMPKKVAIALGLAALAIGGFFIYKKIKK